MHLSCIRRRSIVALPRCAVRALSVTAPTASNLHPAKSQLVIFDTTLRDGEQSPGCTLQIHEKIAIARQLALLGVDVCEAGFPVASIGDFEAVAQIARDIGNQIEGRRDGRPMVIAGLARAVTKDIDRCYDAVRHAARHRIHLFLATSDLHVREYYVVAVCCGGYCHWSILHRAHLTSRTLNSRSRLPWLLPCAQLKYKLNMSRSEALKRAVSAVAHAASLCSDVEFSAEDAGRTDRTFLCDVIAAVIDAGATTINMPDTVGYTLPHEYGNLFAHVMSHVEGASRATFSSHCHDDLGLAVANTLAAVGAGARQVEVTINGIGERAGNASLEEVVMAIATWPGMFDVSTDINTKQITKTSRMVSSLTGMAVQANKAIGAAASRTHDTIARYCSPLRITVCVPPCRPALRQRSGRQRVLPRKRHSPGWHAEEQGDVRDHDTRVRGPSPLHARPWEALGTCCFQG